MTTHDIIIFLVTSVFAGAAPMTTGVFLFRWARHSPRGALIWFVVICYVNCVLVFNNGGVTGGRVPFAAATISAIVFPLVATTLVCATHLIRRRRERRRRGFEVISPKQ